MSRRWGFELAHNDGPHEALDASMLATLQAGFLQTAKRNAGNTHPCGLTAATLPPLTKATAEAAAYNVAPSNTSKDAKVCTPSLTVTVRLCTTR